MKEIPPREPPFQTFLPINTGYEIRKLADENGISVSSQIRRIVIDALVANGLDYSYLTEFQRREWTPTKKAVTKEVAKSVKKRVSLQRKLAKVSKKAS